jgi:hypothetical protein
VNREPQAREKFLAFSEAYAVLADDRQRCVRSPPPPSPLRKHRLKRVRERERQTVVRPFPRRVGRPTPITTPTSFFLLALRVSERGAAPERELCLGAPPPPSSPGPESTRTLPAPPAPAPLPPPFADIVVGCVGRSSFSPGDSWHTALPSPTCGVEGDGVGPCQSRLWACEGSATCRRNLHRCRLRWHHGEKLSENRDAILFTHMEDTRAASFFFCIRIHC